MDGGGQGEEGGGEVSGGDEEAEMQEVWVEAVCVRGRSGAVEVEGGGVGEEEREENLIQRVMITYIKVLLIHQ